MIVCLPTSLVVRDLDSEFCIRLEARIETGRVFAARGQRHTRFTEKTLCHRMKD